jgi:hypothetical protein
VKITTAVKASVFAAALGFACLLPATVRAQAEVAPDFYELSNTETTAAQAKANFEGTFSLPYHVQCSGKDLKPGQYLVSVKSEGESRVVTIHGSGENVKIQVHEAPANGAVSQSALLVRKSGEGRRLEGVYVERLNTMLYLETNTNGSQGETERLPISSSVK